MRTLVLVADAFLLGMPIVSARARIHRGHQHERRGVFRRIFRPTNTYYPVLQRLTHHLQNGTIELWQFIQAEGLTDCHNSLASLSMFTNELLFPAKMWAAVILCKGLFCYVIGI